MNSVTVGMMDRYEIYVETPSRLLVEAFTCGGKILVRGSSNLYQFNKDNYEVSLNSEANSHIVGAIDVEAGTYYLAVKSIYQSYAELN